MESAGFGAGRRSFKLSFPQAWLTLNPRPRDLAQKRLRMVILEGVSLIGSREQLALVKGSGRIGNESKHDERNIAWMKFA